MPLRYVTFVNTKESWLVVYIACEDAGDENNSTTDCNCRFQTDMATKRQNIRTAALKRSYDAILKIIFCVFGVTEYVDIVQKTHYFSNTVHYCSSTMPRLYQMCHFSTKPFLPTSAVCSDRPADTVHCDWPNTTSARPKCNAPYHNRDLQLSK